MESKYLLKDPKLLLNDPQYPTYGPMGLCRLISKEYGHIYKDGDWPVIADTMSKPDANLSPVSSTQEPTPSSASTGGGDTSPSSNPDSSTDPSTKEKEKMKQRHHLLTIHGNRSSRLMRTKV